MQDHTYVSQVKIPFKDWLPGRYWTKDYLKQQKLCTKKASMIGTACKVTTANLFLLFHFYDITEKIEKIANKKLQSRQIWNCNKSRATTGKYRDVSLVGKLHMVLGENTTVLATCSAFSRVLSLLVAFSGKNFQSPWKRTSVLQQTMHGIIDRGWMTVDAFSGWFDEFTKQVKERPVPPLYGGHILHMSLTVIRKITEEDINIVRFHHTWSKIC